jgi:hypothetical protein
MHETYSMDIDTEDTIDLNQRPQGYFWPLSLETHLLTQVKSGALRTSLEALIAEGRHDEVQQALAQLPVAELAARGVPHPRFLGGAFLPNHEDGEVEIARIEIASKTFDVTSVYARRSGKRIHYRVVDEYEGGTLTDKTERTSTKPLTLGELESFFLGAWPFFEVLAVNFEGDVEGMLTFFGARSEFYPDLDALLRQRVLELYGTDDEDQDEVEEDSDPDVLDT